MGHDITRGISEEKVRELATEFRQFGDVISQATTSLTSAYLALVCATEVLIAKGIVKEEEYGSLVRRVLDCQVSPETSDQDQQPKFKELPNGSRVYENEEGFDRL